MAGRVSGIDARKGPTSRTSEKYALGLSVRPLCLLSTNAVRSDAPSLQRRLQRLFQGLQPLRHPYLSRPVRLLPGTPGTTLLLEARCRPSLVQKLHKCRRLRRQFKEQPLRAHLQQLCEALAYLHWHEVRPVARGRGRGPGKSFERRAGGGGGLGARPWWLALLACGGAEGGGFGTQKCVYQMAPPEFPIGKLRFVPRWSLWSEGRGSGGEPPSLPPWF